ncbi:uncharacterized protein G2W53_043865 [Senna tora]|uniref:Uncharacterized protein n=1 Tax=Senna tora TaxID=362788 RepID=A0A834W5C1_9FABA|nr:uncharacterized protein G2W53_043865 [Senna tora]
MEKQSHVLVEILEKMKDVVLISSLTKSTEAAVNASNQVIRNRCADSAAKRKRHTQES